MRAEDGRPKVARTRHFSGSAGVAKAMESAKTVYGAAEAFPQKETYGLQSQMRRCAVSVPSNIAEGHGRLDDGHFRQFLATSRGSLFELQTQLLLSADLGFLEVPTGGQLMEQCEEIARMINGLLSMLD